MGSTCCATKYQGSAYEIDTLQGQGSQLVILNKQSISQQEQMQPEHSVSNKEQEHVTKLEIMKNKITPLQVEEIKHPYVSIEDREEEKDKVSIKPIEQQQQPEQQKEIESKQQQNEESSAQPSIVMPELRLNFEKLDESSPSKENIHYSRPSSSASPKKKSDRKKETSIVASNNNTTTFTSPRIFTNTTKNICDPTTSPSQKQRSIGSATSVRMGVELFVNLKRISINNVYSLGQVLGQGAFGKVWRVTHKTTGLIRAMKQIKKSELIKEEETKLFSEMNILKKLDHPHIVKLYELYQDQNNYFLITEFLSGGELFDRIKKMMVFSEKRASELISQILMAINYCHENQIVHRDLKPENVLFSGPEPDLNLKIIDFGCSRRFTANKMTKKLGTPYYIAPEVLGHNYNEKCDVWSCGVILYILLCGYPPFTGKSENEIFEKVKSGRLKFPSEDWDVISKEAKHLIQRMIQVDVHQRYSAAQALSDPWFQKHISNTSINKKVMENLEKFQATSEFRTAIVQYIISQMTNTKELEDLQMAFQQLDTNRDGVLSKAELLSGYKRIYKNQEEAEEHVEKIINEIDKNQSGQIDYSEFIMATINQSKILSIKKIEQAFRIFDQDGDGFITKQELEDIMGAIDQDVWQLFLQECDVNNDGKISYQEFQKLFKFQ